MSSGFSGSGAPDFFSTTGRINNGRSIAMNINNNNHHPHNPYRSPIAGIISDPSSQIFQRRPDLIGKRSLAEFQAQHQQQQQQNHLFQQQNQQGLGIYLRNVKPRNYQQVSPISPLSPVDFSASISPETTISSSGLPILQQLRPQPINLCNGNGNFPSNSINTNFSTLSYPNWVQNNRGGGVVLVGNQNLGQESEKKMMNNKLQELEKQLLDDDDDADNGDEQDGDALSAITTSEWSETIQNLISPSPTSSSSSCSSSSATTPIICPKQSLTEAATAISEGRPEAAMEILLTRLNQFSNVRGTSEQRLTAYMASALKSRVNPTEHPPPVSELFSTEHSLSTQMLHDVSPCFKLGFMAANLGIIEAVSNTESFKLHVVDFDIGHGGQYVHLLHALAAMKPDKPISLKITTTFPEFASPNGDRLRSVGHSLNEHARKLGVGFGFNVLGLKICDLSRETLGVEIGEALAVNFSFKLYKLPDESVTTENLRDELLRRVKGLSPAVVTVVEQEMNANTASFASRVGEAWGHYGALFDSLDATVSGEKPERVRIEEGLGRRAANSVACEGRDRVERCEVFGKWRARMGMAGFGPRQLSQHVADSLRAKLDSWSRGNPGFTVREESGGICFGWKGRTLTVASAWR